VNSSSKFSVNGKHVQLVIKDVAVTRVWRMVVTSSEELNEEGEREEEKRDVIRGVE
ncbi:hypothetical protein Tco_1454703, partial [Tanacetum coccineum]